MSRKRILLLLGLLCIVLLADYTFCVAKNNKKEIELNKKNLSMKIQEQCQLKLKGANKKKVKWKSSNKKIAVVRKGIVRTKGVGRCVITAECSGKKYKCVIRVKKNSLKDNNMISEKQIFLTLETDFSTSKVIHYTIANNTDTEYLTGKSFVLEKREGEIWKVVKMKADVVFTQEALIIPANEKVTLTVNLENFFDNLTEGEYRFSKELNTQEIISAKFSI